MFVAPVEPWSRENGSSVIISDLLEGLFAVGGTDLLPVFLRRSPDDRPTGRPSHNRGTTLGVEGLPRWASVVGALASGRSPLRMRFANARVARAVLQAVRARSFSPTLVHVEHLPVVDIGLRLAAAFNCPLVYRAHNIESELWERRLGLGGPLGRWLVSRLGRLEVEAMEACDLTLCISDVDLAWARARGPAARAELLPCTLLHSRYERLAAGAPTPMRRIGFVGGLDWAPNEAGLRWFVDAVLPRIVAGVPDTTLSVLARGAADRPWIARNPAVRLVPQTDDAPSLFAASRVSIAPLLQGGGIRVKILESLAVGCPVVATRIGGEGLELSGLTNTDDPARFADACVRHLREASGPAARHAVSEGVRVRHGAEVVARRLVDSWAGVLAHANERG